MKQASKKIWELLVSSAFGYFKKLNSFHVYMDWLFQISIVKLFFYIYSSSSIGIISRFLLSED